MGKQWSCPNCNSRVKGRTLYQCSKCWAVYCLETNLFGFSNGCGSSGRCPSCNQSTYGGKNRQVGSIR